MKIVVVTWRDAVASSAWMPLEDRNEVAVIKSIGAVVEADGDKIILAGAFGTDCYGCDQVIPKENVVSIETIKHTHTNDNGSALYADL